MVHHQLASGFYSLMVAVLVGVDAVWDGWIVDTLVGFIVGVVLVHIVTAISHRLYPTQRPRPLSRAIHRVWEAATRSSG